jgi:hypothetical protein
MQSLWHRNFLMLPGALHRCCGASVPAGLGRAQDERFCQFAWNFRYGN